MSEQPITPAPAEATDTASIATRQAILGEEWARIYADPNVPINNRAEMILRNPSVYLQDVDPAQLPGELPVQWQRLLGFCDGLAAQADTEPVSWAPHVHGLEKLQTMVQGGRVDPGFRGPVGFVIRSASNLFAESLPHVPGPMNPAYYQANLDSAEASLQRQLPEAA
jgi:hypothetical protein